MTNDECPMCAEYEISDDYVVLRKEELARKYIPIAKIEQRIKELESRDNTSELSWIDIYSITELKKLLPKNEDKK